MNSREQEREQGRDALRKWARQMTSELVQDLLEEYPEMDYDEARWWVRAAVDGLARATFASSAAGLHT